MVYIGNPVIILLRNFLRGGYRGLKRKYLLRHSKTDYKFNVPLKLSCFQITIHIFCEISCI